MGNLFSSTVDDEYGRASSSTVPSALQNLAFVQAEALRKEARELMLAARAASEQSQREYQSGSRAEAKTLSIKKTDLYKQMDEKNDQAAKLFFEHYNQTRPKNIIDLHGLYVAEALKYLQQRIDQCRSENISSLTVITGIGNNSPDNIAKIKPEVETFARKNRLHITSQGGTVVIDLSPDTQSARVDDRTRNSCIVQ